MPSDDVLLALECLVMVIAVVVLVFVAPVLVRKKKPMRPVIPARRAAFRLPCLRGRRK